MEKYIKPEFGKDAFTCPHCGVFSQIKWIKDEELEVYINNDTLRVLEFGYCFAQCMCCKEFICFRYQSIDGYGLFNEGVMVYPKQTIIPPAEDMPEHIKEIYKEASLIFGDSPRASCALLRLALQELMIYFRDNFEEYSSLKGENINNDIKTLVGLGLSPKIQKALDIVRITGNSAVHPNKLDVNDNLDIAESLFRLLNLIVEEMITKPKEIDEIFRRMPEREKESVKKRDNEK